MPTVDGWSEQVIALGSVRLHASVGRWSFRKSRESCSAFAFEKWSLKIYVQTAFFKWC